jgi:hypothetical protein
VGWDGGGKKTPERRKKYEKKMKTVLYLPQYIDQEVSSSCSRGDTTTIKQSKKIFCQQSKKISWQMHSFISAAVS